jgi:uncharacterized membrane protein
MQPASADEIEEARLLEMEAQQRRSVELRRTATSQQAAAGIFSSYFSRKFFQGVAVLFPVIVSIFAVYWFVEIFDGFFSPLYHYLLGFHVFGLGAITSMLFIFGTGVFTSSWVGHTLVGVGDYLIRKLPLVKQIYNAAKQVSSALSPDESGKAFR